jgi:hypothetical protein
VCVPGPPKAVFVIAGGGYVQTIKIGRERCQPEEAAWLVMWKPGLLATVFAFGIKAERRRKAFGITFINNPTRAFK